MKLKINLIGILVVALVVFAGCASTSDVGKSGDGNAVLSLDVDSKNLGDISQSEGIMSTEFTITNDGSDDLIITAMDTSCMCTTAQIITDDATGPVYGMSTHGNPTGESVIEPGTSATLKLFYDPNVHGDLRGPVTRMVNIMSNAGTKQIRIKLNQVE